MAVAHALMFYQGRFCACDNSTTACAYHVLRAKMLELRLGVLRGEKVVCGSLCVDVEEEVTCRELVDQLKEVGLLSGAAEMGAWHLVERWNGCGT